MTELVASNVVVTANQFNPSIVNQVWLLKNGIVSEDDFESAAIFAEGVSQIQTKLFQLLVVPQMLQFVIKPGLAEKEESRIAQKVGSIVNALPHTPYVAIGLNFVWHLKEESEGMRELTRRLFFKPGRPPFSLFDVPDARFGAYLSKDFDKLRLKLDIKPIVVKEADKAEEDRLIFTFNFNKDLTPENAVSAIGESLLLWDAAKIEAKKIVSDTLGR